MDAYVQLAKKEGGQVLVGGQALTDGELAKGSFYLPTIITGLDNSAQTCQEEIFGPVLAVTTFKDDEEALALAAIVEKETADPSERRRIAGLYSNRLKKGMRLEADPTVIYPVTRGKPLGRRILRSELQADNAYNTYRKTGLPAGPITSGTETTRAPAFSVRAVPGP